MVDPALMNFLEYAKAQEQQMANPQVQIQNGQGMMPSMAPQQAPSNPFDSGIRRAIDSARESLGMNQEQKDIALRRGLFGFANKMSQQPVQKGFWNNFGAIGQAIGQGVNDYDVASEQAMMQNNALANQILQYNNLQQAQAAKAEQDAWKRKYMEDELAWKQQHMADQLSEQQRYHDIMGKRMGAGMVNGFSGNVEGSLGSEFQPIQTRNELIAYAKDKKALGTVLQEINELDRTYTKFRQDYADNTFDPMSPVSPVSNRVKDFWGKFADNKSLRAETADRKTLGSKLNKFVVSSERALKGGGVMGPTLIKLFQEQGIYPDLDHDTPEIFESKLKMLKEELENSYKAANLSLSHGIRVDPSQVRELETRMNTNVQESLPPQATGVPPVSGNGVNTADPFAAAGIIFDQ